MKEIIEILKYNNLMLNPCSREDILSLERVLDAKLPKSYTEFLEAAGRGASKYMLGSMWTFNDLEIIQKEAIELLTQNGFRALPQNAFVFWMHQGYQFAFFIIGEEDNPPVYYYNETERNIDFIRTYEKLTDFFYDELINSKIDIPNRK